MLPPFFSYGLDRLYNNQFYCNELRDFWCFAFLKGIFDAVCFTSKKVTLDLFVDGQTLSVELALFPIWCIFGEKSEAKRPTFVVGTYPRWVLWHNFIKWGTFSRWMIWLCLYGISFPVTVLCDSPQGRFLNNDFC